MPLPVLAYNTLLVGYAMSGTGLCYQYYNATQCPGLTYIMLVPSPTPRAHPPLHCPSRLRSSWYSSTPRFSTRTRSVLVPGTKASRSMIATIPIMSGTETACQLLPYVYLVDLFSCHATSILVHCLVLTWAVVLPGLPPPIDLDGATIQGTIPLWSYGSGTLRSVLTGDAY
eukprot:1341383-Rhodomonas_salina.1